VTTAASLAAALTPLHADPARCAVLLDVDGTLAPIVRHAADAHVPESTRALVVRLAGRYGLVACVSGRRAAEARRIVSIGSIVYIGGHGSEVLRPGATQPTLDPDVAAWAPRVQAFAASSYTRGLERLRVRLEDKGPIVALHWRGAPDEAAAHAAVAELAATAEAEGLATHWGRKVLEVRPPVRIDKGAGVIALLGDARLAAALYVGDDATDLDAFHGLAQLVSDGRLAAAVRVAVRSEEGPTTLADEADVVVEGPEGVRALLAALLGD